MYIIFFFQFKFNEQREKQEDKILEQQEFELPLEDFESVIDEYRKSDTSTEDTSSLPAISPVKTPGDRKSRSNKRLSNSSTPNDDTSFIQADSEDGKMKRKNSPTRRSARGSSSLNSSTKTKATAAVDGSASVKRKRAVK